MNHISQKYNDVIFVSFYTKNGKYPALAENLSHSLRNFDLSYDIESIDEPILWSAACRLKSEFILRKLMEYRRSVVWLDIDTEVWREPILLFGSHDFAIYNWFADSDHHLSGRIPFDPNSVRLCCSGGVSKWGYTAPALELLFRWSTAAVGWEKGDDPVLDQTFNDFSPPVNALWLPKTYNRMDKHTEHWRRIPQTEVVINHDYTGGKHGHD